MEKELGHGKGRLDEKYHEELGRSILHQVREAQQSFEVCLPHIKKQTRGFQDGS
jgi:hypothetical protein